MLPLRFNNNRNPQRYSIYRNPQNYSNYRNPQNYGSYRNPQNYSNSSYKNQTTPQNVQRLSDRIHQHRRGRAAVKRRRGAREGGTP